MPLDPFSSVLQLEAAHVELRLALQLMAEMRWTMPKQTELETLSRRLETARNNVVAAMKDHEDAKNPAGFWLRPTPSAVIPRKDEKWLPSSAHSGCQP